MDDEPSGKAPTLEVALIGTLVMASLICVRLWQIMSQIREALTDPNAMAFIITEGSVKSDSQKAEQMLGSAQAGFADTEGVVAIFSVSLALIALALVVRVWRRPDVARNTASLQSGRTKRKRPLTH